jgi:hypothetical protein
MIIKNFYLLEYFKQETINGATNIKISQKPNAKEQSA